MPNIRTYESKVPVPQPDAGAASAVASAARSTGAMFRQLGQTAEGVFDTIDKYKGREETSALTNAYAQGFAQLTQNWNETIKSADPNDTSVADKWREQVLQPFLDTFGEDQSSSTAGRDLRQRLQAQMQMHFFDKTIADQSAMSGAAVQSNLEASGNALSAAAFADPSSFETSIKILDTAIDAQIASHAVTASQAAQIRSQVRDTLAKQIASGAFYGLSNINPSAAIDELNDGKFLPYFNGSEVQSLTAHATEQERIRVSQEHSAQDWADKQAKKQYDAKVSEAQATLIQPDGSIAITPDYFSKLKEASNLPGARMDPEGTRAAVNFGRAILEEQESGGIVASDPHVYEDFGKRLLLPDNDATRLTSDEIYKARIDKRLSSKDATFYLSALKNLDEDPARKIAEKRYSEFLTAMKPVIAQSDMFGNILKPVMAQNWYTFQHDTRAKFEAAYKTGNWKDLLDPRSTDYLGQDAIPLATNRKDAMSSIKAIIQQGPASAIKPPSAPAPVPHTEIAPRKPGETWDEYKKRTGYK